MLLLLPIGTASQTRTEHDSGSRTFHVLHYDVQIEPDLASKTIVGKVAARFVALAPLTSVEFDCGNLTIDTVRTAGQDLQFRQQDHRLIASLRIPAKAHETQVIEVTFHGAPGRGFSFYPDKEQVYTAFSTSEWMVCIDAPDDKATIRLGVIVPSSWTVVGNGRTTAQRALPNGRTLHEFSQDTPVSTYTFGFAAGRYRTVAERSGRVELRYVTSGLGVADVRRIFATTADMLAFFVSRSGVPYPDSSYTQVLGAGTVQQEMSGFSMLNDSYGAWVLDHPEDVSLGAHELAHQWWGNSVTCRDWNHFWLNEGMATFMAAAYIEHRFGRESYLRLIEEYRASYELVRQAGHDKPLVFPNWSHPTSDDRTIVYRKGAYVLDLLRQKMGEDAFWAGIRSYTRTHVGESVTTRDFQTAMEHAAGASLSDFFAKWVYQQ